MNVRFLFIAMIFFSSFVWAMPSTIIIIRHGEKQGSNLSERGRERAKALVGYFQNDSEMSKLGPISSIYTFQPKTDSHRRGLETVQPLAAALGLKVNTDFKNKKYEKMVDAVIDDTSGTMLVCWDHKYIPDIAGFLGLNNPPGWDSDTFDRTWVLHFDGSGQVTDFHDYPQHLLPGDSDKIE